MQLTEYTEKRLLERIKRITRRGVDGEKLSPEDYVLFMVAWRWCNRIPDDAVVVIRNPFKDERRE
jgi:hypothetical protein